MVSEQLVDVRYRGLEVGRGLRLSHVGPRTAYLALDAPLPVGSELQLAVTDGPRIAVRVLRVHESPGELPPGMRLGIIGGEAEARAWWEALVTETDPVIPEPAGGHGTQTAPEPAGDPGADDAVAARDDDASATRDDAGDEVAGGDDTGDEAVAAANSDPAEDDAADATGSRRARVTEVMSTAEIEAIVQDAGGEAPAGLVEETSAGLAEGVPAELDDVAAVEEPGVPAGELEAQGKGKGKKRRRRARSRR